MTSPLNPRLVTSYRNASRAAGGIVVAIGFLVLVGWLFDVPAFKSILPGLSTMKANTALAFMLAGSSLWLASTRGENERIDLLADACAALTSVIGLLTLSEYMFGRNLGIDQFLFKDTLTPESAHPGRMSLVTALNFSLLGPALLLMTRTHYRRLIEVFSITALLISMLALLGYAYGVSSLYQFFPYSSIAIHTTLAFSILCIGILFAHPEQGLMRVFSGDNLAGLMARRLTPAALVIPFLLGWLFLTGQRMGHYDSTLRLVLSSISTVIIFAILILWNASLLERADLVRQQTQTQLSQSEERKATILDTSLDAIITIDHMGQVLEFNPAAQKIFGYAEAEVLGKEMSQLIIPPSLREQHRTGLANYLVTGEGPVLGKRIEMNGMRADGTEFPVELTITLNAGSELPVFTGFVRDITQRRRAEKTLRESEERFRLIVEAAPSAIIAVDADGKINLINTRAQELFGYRQEELLERPVELLIPERFRNRHLRYRQNFLTQPTSRSMGAGRDLFCLHKDGHEVPVEIGLTPYETSEGPFTLALIVDITERKLAEERFQLAVESAPNAIILADQNGSILMVNSQTEKFFGYRRRELVGLNVDSLVPERLHSKHGGYRAGFIADPQVRSMGIGRDLRALRKDGSEFPVEIGLTPIETPDDLIVMATIVDITERKQAEAEIIKLNAELEQRVVERTAALSQANGLLQMMLDHMPDQIYFKDAQSRFIRNSRSQAKALGLSDPAEAVGKSDFDFFPHAQLSYEKEQEIIRSGKPLVDEEERIVWPDGRETWVSTTKIPLPDQSGQIIGTFGISRDITERKRAEVALQKAKLELEAANKELEAFSYSVSHDLRSPLRTIDGFSQALLQDYADQLPAEGQNYLTRVRAAAQRMGQLIDDLLNLSKVTRAPMKLVPVDLSGLAQGIVAELQRTQPERQVNFSLTPNLKARGDPGLLQAVLENLLNNAWKFTSKREQAEIEFGSKSEKDETVYFIRDNGAGFDMTYAGKLFGAFQRLHAMTEYSGTGIGLATVQRIINRHGGRIWAEGAVDQGATFFFTLPALERAKPEAVPPQEKDSLARRAKAII